MNKETFDSLKVLLDDYNYFYNFYAQIKNKKILLFDQNLKFPFEIIFFKQLLKITNFWNDKLIFWTNLNSNSFYCLNKTNSELKAILKKKENSFFEIVLNKNNYLQFQKILIFKALTNKNIHYLMQGELIFKLINVHKLDLITIARYASFDFTFLEQLFILYNFDSKIKNEFLNQAISFKSACLFIKVKNNEEFILELLTKNKQNKLNDDEIIAKIKEFKIQKNYKKLNIVKFKNNNNDPNVMVTDILKLNLEQKLQTKIVINENKITIFYKNLTNLKKIIRKLEN